MLLLQCCPSLSSQNTFFFTPSDPTNHLSYHFRNPRRSVKFTCLVKVGLEDIAQVLHNKVSSTKLALHMAFFFCSPPFWALKMMPIVCINPTKHKKVKVLIAAGVSAAIGQLSKPFAGTLLYGKVFDLKAAIQAGGFPSTHSSSVVAAATCLGLERGFSDSFFGLTVVYAGLVMYDAQGVRREVGIHAKVLNKVLPKTQINSIDGQEGASSTLNMESLDPLLANGTNSSTSKSANASPLLLRSDKKMRQTEQMVMPSGLAGDIDEESDRSMDNSTNLKESVGHTEVEVVAGAVLGFFVSLVVSSLM